MTDSLAAPLDDGLARSCAEWSRLLGRDPVGTAGSYTGYLLLEWPLPWPRDLGEVPQIRSVVEALKGSGIRLQGIAPIGPGDGGRHAILYLRRPAEEGFEAFGRREVVTSEHGLVDAALALLSERDRGELVVESGPRVVDLLVCSHGRRDRCCGAMGTRLAVDLAAVGDELGSDVRLWRTSHTGGHRFAPTMLVLPEGTLWAHADVDLVKRVLRRDGTLDGLLERYRGCSGLGPPRAQALERAVLATVGWPLFSSSRQVEGGQADGTVALHVGGPGPQTTWEAEVTTAHLVPSPPCGGHLGEAGGTDPVFTVGALRHR